MLRGRPRFAALFRGGVFVKARGMNLLYRERPGKTLVAVCIGRNQAGAVKRNRLRRVVRESLNPLIPECPEGFDLAFFPNPFYDRLDQKEREKAIRQLLARLGRPGRSR